ncbi:MAG: hypothetical protein M1821_003666 [Bathelium mastoideum]|nr:MAG: hypothetical protein M1821_003666 [Bathelium mastoideum]
MPWRPLPRIAFAVCIYPFQPSSPADLPLEIGDELYIIERGGANGDWYRGYLVAPPSLLAGLTSSKGQTLEARVFSGIFPRTCVEVRELLGEADIHGNADEEIRRTSPPLATETNGDLGINGTQLGLDRSPSNRQGRTEDAPTPSKPADALSRPRSRRSLSRRTSKRYGRDLTSQPASGQISPRLLQLQQAAPISPVSTEPRPAGTPKPPAPVPMLKIGDESPTSEAEPLVDEIASCLREWHSTNVHELLLARKYKQLEKMAHMVTKLDIARKQLLHNVLTMQELRRVRETTVWDLVNGNKMLRGEVIVRSPSERGRILTADDSAIEITKLQSMMSVLNEPPVSHADKDLLHHLFIHVRSVTGNLHRHITISMSLYIKPLDSPACPLSEAHAIDIPAGEIDDFSASDEKMKTIFTDLSAADIGEGAGAGSRVYLVFKILNVEPFRTSSANDAWIPSHSQNPSMSGSTLTPSSSGSAKAGRRSLMWGQKARRETAHMVNIHESRQHTNSSGSSTPDGRSGSPMRGSTWDSPKTVKRVIGMGVLEVDDLMRQSREADYQVDIFTHRMPFEDGGHEGGAWNDLTKEIYPTPSESFKKCSLVKQLQVHIKAFADPDADGLIRTTPTMLQGIFSTRRIGFSGAPTKPRSDIYITLKEPILSKNSFLSHPKAGIVPLTVQTSLANLQLTLEVRRENGERIENCIYPSCNSAGHTAWRTAAVERGESWNSTIRLAIPPEDVPGCHLIMSIADIPEFPFALSWMPLWTSEAFVRDGDHSLVLYKYDEYTSSMISGRGAYLALPWRSKKKDEEVTGPVAALKLRTYLSSTKYSQDPILLGVLKWKSQTPGELVKLLHRFVFVPELEIVKLLSEVFDALFQILTEYAGSDENGSGCDENEDLVFSALIRVLSIVHDRRFNLQPLVDKYAEGNFNWPFATPCLIRSFNRLLADPTDPETSRKLRATLKVGGHVLKFIVNARNQQKEKEAGIGITGRQPVFAQDIRSIFRGLNDMMKNPAPILIGTKTLAVQNLHVWLPELSAHMETKDILKLAEDFVNSCADLQGKIVLYKLVLIVHLVGLELFSAPEIRQNLMKQTISWLGPHWGKTENMTEQWKDQIRLCCSVVAALLDRAGEQVSEFVPKLVESYAAIQVTPRQEKTSLSLLFPMSYPFPSRPASLPARFDETMVEIAAVLAAIFNLPIRVKLDLPGLNLPEFLLEALQAYKSLLDCDAFPGSWLSVHVYHHKSAILALERLAGTLLESFIPNPEEADTFHTDLWRAFFDTLISLVGSDALALETFPEQKRRAVWKIAGDVREAGANLLRLTWEAIGWDSNEDDKERFALEKIGGYQVQYVPALVAPIVELCLSVHQGLRSVAVGILRTMIISEWMLNEDLDIIQAEMIDCLDNLYKSKPLTESILQKLFITELMDSFAPLAETTDNAMFIAVKQLIGTIDELLDLLAAVHGDEAESEAFHIMDRLHLMEFLKDMQKEDIYIRYVHQLAKLQSDAKNHTEAGLALRLHSELYEWNPNAMLELLEEPAFPTQTEFERKEQLYFQQIRHFEEGASWENALGAYGELAVQYEHNVFDFHKLARTQRAMATIHERIASGERQHPRYFRVVYKGLGFPNSLRDKQFVFEGSPQDRLATFTDKMQQQHPAAQILGTSKDEELEGQFLQIYHISPLKNLNHPIYQRQKVSQPIREHYLQSRPNQFVTSSRRQASKDAKITEVSVEKTMYSTAETFPTILRRSEIIKVEDITLDPLQAAIERTTRKSQELLTLDKRAGESDSGLTLLNESLLSSVDPDAELSVSHYRELLPKPEQPGSDDGMDEEEPELPQLSAMENALRVALLDHTLIIKRCLNRFSKPDQEATKTHLTQRKRVLPGMGEGYLAHNLTFLGFETTFRPELLALMPTQQTNASHLRDLAISPRPSISASTPRAQSPITQASAGGIQPLTAASPTSASKRQSRQEKGRRSLAFLRRGGSVDNGKSNGAEPDTDLNAKLNRLGLYDDAPHETPPTTRSDATGESGQAATGAKASTKEPTLRNRFSFHRSGGATGTTDTASTGTGTAPPRTSQSQHTESTMQRESSHISSDRGVGNERRESVRLSQRSRKNSSLSQAREERGGGSGEGTKKRFSVLGLGRKGSKGAASAGSGSGSKSQNKVVLEE